MPRSAMFEEPYVSLRNLPYEFRGEDALRTTPTGGVLPRGHVVWAGGLTEPLPLRVLAYVDEIGMVTLDPQWLVARDALQAGGGR